MQYFKDAYQTPVVLESTLPRPKPWLAHPFVAVAGMAQTIESVLSPPHTYMSAESTVVVVPNDERLSAHALLVLLKLGASEIAICRSEPVRCDGMSI